MVVRSKFSDCDIKYNVRPDTLINPKTGRKLELDIFLPKKGIAFEFQGNQHSRYYQSFKDEVKRLWCIRNAIKLKTIWGHTLLNFCNEFGVNKKSKLYEHCEKYQQAQKYLNLKRKYKRSPHNRGKIKGAFAVKCVDYNKLQEAESEQQRYKALIKSGILPSKAKNMIDKEKINFGIKDIFRW